MTQDANKIETPPGPPVYLDAKGLRCPMPVIKLQQTIRRLETPTKVIIDCTDLSAEKDIASWCKVNKHRLCQVEKTDFGIKLTIDPNIS
jgi:tRNA 2-thiouridine synthesizing protein A